jgi:hypothetical protein
VFAAARSRKDFYGRASPRDCRRNPTAVLKWLFSNKRFVWSESCRIIDFPPVTARVRHLVHALLSPDEDR